MKTCIISATEKIKNVKELLKYLKAVGFHFKNKDGVLLFANDTHLPSLIYRVVSIQNFVQKEPFPKYPKYFVSSIKELMTFEGTVTNVCKITCVVTAYCEIKMYVKELNQKLNLFD